MPIYLRVCFELEKSYNLKIFWRQSLSQVTKHLLRRSKPQENLHFFFEKLQNFFLGFFIT